jgi:hypothetical protein|tara:strand:+ start:4425 stop:4595 length:171 start_codon:yes stop_codon:yes gene_type:complete
MKLRKKGKTDDIPKDLPMPILRVKTTRSWESFAIGLIVGMTFAFITFSMGYYTDVR